MFLKWKQKFFPEVLKFRELFSEGWVFISLFSFPNAGGTIKHWAIDKFHLEDYYVKSYITCSFFSAPLLIKCVFQEVFIVTYCNFRTFICKHNV